VHLTCIHAGIPCGRTSLVIKHCVQHWCRMFAVRPPSFVNTLSVGLSSVIVHPLWTKQDDGLKPLLWSVDLFLKEKFERKRHVLIVQARVFLFHYWLGLVVGRSPKRTRTYCQDTEHAMKVLSDGCLTLELVMMLSYCLCFLGLWSCVLWPTWQRVIKYYVKSDSEAVNLRSHQMVCYEESWRTGCVDWLLLLLSVYGRLLELIILCQLSSKSWKVEKRVDSSPSTCWRRRWSKHG
jgi:hypothetical protein